MGSFDSVIQHIGMTNHYDSIKRGVIDLSDVIYFLSVITLFMYAALTVIKTLKK
jgi:ABC-2 type transport system permease protein